ncbi:hypothetical protein LDL36_20150 [Komagataeibacter sp. FNDCR1]|nr:hypothetical protein [Komagataeibacter sp. FNDCR1]
MTDKQTTGGSQDQGYNVATSSVICSGIAFPSSTSAEERNWVEAHFISESFASSADFLVGQERFKVNPSLYFLYAHAIEQAIKGYLLGRGTPQNEVKKLGHNLLKLLRKARAKGLNTSDPNTDTIVTRLNKAGEQAAIRYNVSYCLNQKAT